MNIAWIESGLLFVVWWPLFGFAGDIIWPYSVSPQASIAKLYAINLSTYVVTMIARESIPCQTGGNLIIVPACGAVSAMAIRIRSSEIRVVPRSDAGSTIAYDRTREA
jgi:hypothetical protein